ncbi:MAG: glucosaminidase domain-containing protein [Candidatus Korobacteraceae bacterium]
MTKSEFVQQACAAATRSSEQSGMPAMVTVAQAALESNWGQSQLSQQANNYFGIKAHGNHDCVLMPTDECENGASVEIHAEFARYLSMLECFRCRDGILLRGAVYAGAREQRGDEGGFITELAKHWATDPRYAEKLLAVLKEVKGMVAIKAE